MSSHFRPDTSKKIYNTRPEIAGGFKMPSRRSRNGNQDPNFGAEYGQGGQSLKMGNPMDKNQIMASLGIMDPDQEHELDWDKLG